MRATIRRAQLLCGGTVMISLLGFGLPGVAAAQGQSPGARTNPPEPDRFVRFALSSAALQERVSGLAASRDTKPEVRAFARDMERFRNQQIARLRTLAQGRGQKMPEQQDFEHRVLVENLEPLDHLELSRRYAEVQVQALEQEIQGYTAATQAADEGVKEYAAAILPELQRRLEAALRVHDAVKP